MSEEVEMSEKTPLRQDNRENRRREPGGLSCTPSCLKQRRVSRANVCLFVYYFIEILSFGLRLFLSDQAAVDYLRFMQIAVNGLVAFLFLFFPAHWCKNLYSLLARTTAQKISNQLLTFLPYIVVVIVSLIELGNMHEPTTGQVTQLFIDFSFYPVSYLLWISSSNVGKYNKIYLQGGCLVFHLTLFGFIVGSFYESLATMTPILALKTTAQALVTFSFLKFAMQIMDFYGPLKEHDNEDRLNFNNSAAVDASLARNTILDIDQKEAQLEELLSFTWESVLLIVFYITEFITLVLRLFVWGHLEFRYEQENVQRTAMGQMAADAVILCILLVLMLIRFCRFVKDELHRANRRPNEFRLLNQIWIYYTGEITWGTFVKGLFFALPLATVIGLDIKTAEVTDVSLYQFGIDAMGYTILGLLWNSKHLRVYAVISGLLIHWMFVSIVGLLLTRSVYTSDVNTDVAQLAFGSTVFELVLVLEIAYTALDKLADLSGKLRELVPHAAGRAKAREANARFAATAGSDNALNV